jgi:hypothetical protein
MPTLTGAGLIDWSDEGGSVSTPIPVPPGASGVSPASICSLAFIQLGLGPIQSMDDQNPRAAAARLQYPSSVDETIYDHKWKFSLVRVALGRLDASPTAVAEAPFDFQFQLPAEPYCLRVWETSLDKGSAWSVEGRLLLCNADTLSIRYGARVMDPNLYDPGFISALVYKLASKLAPPFKPSLATDMRRLYEIELARAKGADSQQQGARSGRSTFLLDARR